MSFHVGFEGIVTSYLNVLGEYRMLPFKLASHRLFSHSKKTLK